MNCCYVPGTVYRLVSDTWYSIKESAEQICIGAIVNEEYVGFLCLKETGKDTLELAVMGGLKE